MASAMKPHTAMSTICHRGKKVGGLSAGREEDAGRGSVNTEGRMRMEKRNLIKVYIHI